MRSAAPWPRLSGSETADAPARRKHEKVADRFGPMFLRHLDACDRRHLQRHSVAGYAALRDDMRALVQDEVDGGSRDEPENRPEDPVSARHAISR